MYLTFIYIYIHTYILTYIYIVYSTYICVCMDTHTQTQTTSGVTLKYFSCLLTSITTVNQFPKKKQSEAKVSSLWRPVFVWSDFMLCFICTGDEYQVRTFPHKNFYRRKNVWKVERFSQRKVQGKKMGAYLSFSKFCKLKNGEY